MALDGFELSQGQGSKSFVTVLADEGATRVVARIDREAIRDRYKVASGHEVGFVRDNLVQLSRVIARTYQAGAHTPHSDDNTRLIVITSNDLNQAWTQ